MTTTPRPLSVRLRVRPDRPIVCLPAVSRRTAGVALALLALMCSLPHPDARAFQVRQHGLGRCHDAITTQVVAGHRVDGFRLVPSSITQNGKVMWAEFTVRLHSQDGWNSGSLRTIHCVVDAERVTLLVQAD